MPLENAHFYLICYNLPHEQGILISDDNGCHQNNKGQFLHFELLIKTWFRYCPQVEKVKMNDFDNVKKLNSLNVSVLIHKHVLCNTLFLESYHCFSVAGFHEFIPLINASLIVSIWYWIAEKALKLVFCENYQCLYVLSKVSPSPCQLAIKRWHTNIVFGGLLYKSLIIFTVES